VTTEKLIGALVAATLAIFVGFAASDSAWAWLTRKIYKRRLLVEAFRAHQISHDPRRPASMRRSNPDHAALPEEALRPPYSRLNS
jgi:hypothetical protein